LVVYATIGKDKGGKLKIKKLKLKIEQDRKIAGIHENLR